MIELKFNPGKYIAPYVDAGHRYSAPAPKATSMHL
jgi:hypothetical protein